MRKQILAWSLGLVFIAASCTAQAEVSAEHHRSAIVSLPKLATTVASWEHIFRTTFDPRILAHYCLATAVYFEARSEPQLGQLAVATVIVNRAKTSTYPSSICGVIYQGAHRRDACQFSFACDGRSDLPQDDRAWETALAVAARALAKERKQLILPSATHFHADNVNPSWSRSLRRVTKIGRHIFYSQG